MTTPMQFYMTSAPNPEYGYLPPIIQAPGVQFGGTHDLGEPNGYVYVNGGWLFPSAAPPWNDTQLMVMVGKCEDICATRPSIVAIDHPQFVGRRSPEAMQAMELAVWRYLRKMLGDDAIVVQYGVDYDDVQIAQSIATSQVVYSPDVFDDFAAGLWPSGRIHDAYVGSSRYDEPDPVGFVEWKVDTVWLPCVGQWTPAAGWWTKDDFRRGLEACAARGVSRVMLWFDPRSFDDGRPKFTQQHFDDTVGLCCYHGRWPVKPTVPAAASSDPFSLMLAALAAVPYDHARVVALLAQAAAEANESKEA